MAQFIQNPYKNINNIYYKRFCELLKSTPFEKWGAITKENYIYKSKSGYFHICTIKRGIHQFYVDDYILTASFQQKHCKTYGGFNKEQLIEFLQRKTA